MDTGVGGGTKAKSDKPAYVIGPRRLGVLMAVAHKPGLSDSAEIFTSKKRREANPSPADGVSRLGFGVYQTRGPVMDFQATASFLPAGNWAVAGALLHLAEIKRCIQKTIPASNPLMVSV